MKPIHRMFLVLMILGLLLTACDDSDDDDAADDDSDDDVDDDSADDDLDDDADDDTDDDTGDDDTAIYPDCPPYDDNMRLFEIDDFYSTTWRLWEDFGGAAGCTVAIDDNAFVLDCEGQDDVVTGTWLTEETDNPLIEGASVRVAGNYVDELTGYIWVVDVANVLLLYNDTTPFDGVNPSTVVVEDMSLTVTGVSDTVCQYRSIEDQPPVFNDNYRWEEVFGGNSDGSVQGLEYSSDLPQSMALIEDGAYWFASVANHYGTVVEVNTKDEADESFHQEIQVALNPDAMNGR